MPSFQTILATAAIAVLGVAAPAFAQTQLVASTPAANASIDKPGKIILVFNEKLVAKSVGAELVMTGMSGMADHQAMKMTGFTTAVSADGKTLTLLMKRALPSGSYDVKWYVAGTDSQRVEGSFAFTVK